LERSRWQAHRERSRWPNQGRTGEQIFTGGADGRVRVWSATAFKKP
jgi:hypothetical protein